jgi:uncharacterized protein YcbK (DUF882 family)
VIDRVNLSEEDAVHADAADRSAIDVRLADVPLSDLRDAARSLAAGGVGYYAGAAGFVHLDTGRVRAW